MVVGMYYACVVLAFSVNVHARVTKPAAVIDYLTKYGYIKLEDGSNKSEQATSMGLLKFQTFMGIIANGKLSKVTKKLIHSPRCGQPDIYPAKIKVGSLIKTILKKKVLKYKITQWTKWLPRTIQNQTIYNMLQLWADDLSVKIKWSKNSSDVNIIFKPDEKKQKGSVNYDVFTEVKFANNVYTIYFYSKAAQSLSALTRTSAHAFGHVFGRGHTKLYSIMSPILRPNYRMANAKCEISLTSAFSHLHMGMTYLVKGEMAWAIQQGYTVEFPPKKASELWKGVPENFDDAFSSGTNYELYFFKGSQYYRYDSAKQRVGDGYPYPISKGWPGIPNDIDAVFSDAKARTYFFKGDKVYLFSETLQGVVKGFPKPISAVFEGLQSNLGAAFRYYSDGDVYFFKDLYYWKLNQQENPDSMKPLGPYTIKYDWRNLCTELY